MNVTTVPFYNDNGQDRAATIATLTEVLGAIAKIPNATITTPAPGVSVADFFDSVSCFLSYALCPDRS